MKKSLKLGSRVIWQTQMNCHYRSLVESKDTWKCDCSLFLYVFERKNNPNNVASELFERYRWIDTTDIWFSPKSRDNLVVQCQKLSLYVLERKTKKSFDRHRWIFTTDLWFSPKSEIAWKIPVAVRKRCTITNSPQRVIRESSESSESHQILIIV